MKIVKIPKIIWATLVILGFVLIYYLQPWRVITDSGEMYILICKPKITSENVWEFKLNNKLFEAKKECKTSQLSTLKLNYRVFPEKQKVVFSGKEIGVMSYKCDIYDRSNFICMEQEIGVENGKAKLYYNLYETAIPKWRYWFIKIQLLIDKYLERESIYKFQ